MLLQASKILNLPIAALDSQSKIAKVHNFIIDPENGKLIAMVVKLGTILKQTKVLSTNDILEFDNNGIVIKNQDDLVEVPEIVRAQKILKDGLKIFGQKAITESKKSLGKIHDLLIDIDTLMVVKYYIANLWQDRILPADKVIKVEKSAVVFSDDVIEGTPVAEAEGAVA